MLNEEPGKDDEESEASKTINSTVSNIVGEHTQKAVLNIENADSISAKSMETSRSITVITFCFLK